MKRFIFVALAVLIMGALVAPMSPAEGKDWKMIASGGLDTMLVGTSAVLDTTPAISFQDKNFLVFQLDLTLASGGNAGAGFVYVEGRVSDGNWVKLPLVDLSDSCAVVYEAIFDGQATLTKYVIVGKALPLGLDTTDYIGGTFVAGKGEMLPGPPLWGDYLPFDKVRAITSDTNWNAVVTVSGSWIYW